MNLNLLRFRINFFNIFKIYDKLEIQENQTNQHIKMINKQGDMIEKQGETIDKLT
jgi:hypothetical protein